MKFLVIGCGSIGERHLSNLINIGEDVASCDISKDLGETIKKRYNILFYSNFEDALGSYNPDAVFVCTPTHLHVSIAAKALKADCHVFIEKPISNTSRRVEELIKLRENKKKVVLVGCNMRFHRAIKYIKEKIDGGEIGRLIFGRAQFGHYLPNWRPNKDYRKIYSANKEMGGGVLLDSIHEIDYMTWFFGQPRSIFSFNLKGSNLEIDVEDVGEILLRYDQSLVEIHVDYLRHYKMRSCEIIGSEGTVIWESLGKTPEKMTLILYSSDGEIVDVIREEIDVNEQYMEEVKHFIRCIEDEATPLNTIENAINSLKIVELAKVSNKLGKTVQYSAI